MLINYIGQRDRIAALEAAMTAYKAGRKLPNMLFLGGSGRGKTRLAHEVAAEIGIPMTVLHAPSVVERKDVGNKIIEASGGILFIDEIHALPKAMAEDLYTVMDENVVALTQDKYTPVGFKTVVAFSERSVPPGEWHGPDFYRVPTGTVHSEETVRFPVNITIIGATTDEARLPSAFLSRLSQLKVHLRAYDDIELGTIVTLYAESQGVEVEADAALFIAQRSRKTPRNAKYLLDRSIDFALADKIIVRLEHAQRALDALGVDSLGLEEPHRAILRVLNEGPLSRTSLAQRLGLSASNLALYWGDLLEQGLVKVSTRHEITEKGTESIGH